MQSSHLARVHRSLVVTAFALALSCADDAARIGATGLPTPARAPAPGAPAAEAGSAAPAPLLVDVGGRVVDDLEVPIIGRSVAVVDKIGRRKEILTDEEGGFHVLGVAPPYDVLVYPAPSGSVITPVAFLGLHRSDPRLEVFEREGAIDRPHSQPLRIAVKLPPCRALTGACWVSVVSASPSGGGGTAGSYNEGAESAIYQLDHAWSEVTVRPGEAIDVHVLVGDAEYTQYAYAKVSHVAARPGETTDLGMITPLAVDSTAPVSVTGRASGQPEGWQWTLASQLDLPGGASVALRYEWTATSTMRLPLVPGAAWHVGAWVQHPPMPERAYFHRSTQAWSGSLPLTAANVALDVPSVPEPVRPQAVDGTLSRKGAGLAWDARSPALASVVLVDVARGAQRVRAFTSEAEVSLKRLEALGVDRLSPGEHVLDLTTTPGADVDELTQPDRRQRLQRFDTRVPGGVTYQRYSFTVTP